MSRQEAYTYGLGILVIVGSLIARYFSLPVMTDDYVFFLRPWFDALLINPGLSAFRESFSNYAPLYLYLLKGLTYLSGSSLLGIKVLSTIFDLILAGGVFLVLRDFRTPVLSRAHLFLAFAVVFSLPTVILNSSMWGQSDALYAAPIIFSFYFMLSGRPLASVLAFGLALTFKLQAIFFAPVFLGYYWRLRQVPAYLLWIPGLFLLSIVPAWIAGGSFWDLLFIYFEQAGEYTALTMAAPSIFAFFEPLPLSDPIRSWLLVVGIFLAVVVVLRIIFVIKKHPQALSTEWAVLIALISVLALPLVLPRMHERYFYLADIFSLLYLFYYPRRWYIPLTIVGVSVLAYSHYLMGTVPWFGYLAIDLRPLSLLLFIVLIRLAYQSKPLKGAA